MWLADQAVRLLKAKWRNATQLAEELYAIFTGEQAVASNAPVAIDNPTPAAPWLTFRNYTPGQSLMQVTGKNGQPIGTFSVKDGDFVFTGAPGPAFTGGNLSFGPDNPTQESPVSSTVPRAQGSERPPQPQPGAGAQAMPGQVLSGSGNTYQVRVYPDGLGAAGQVVTVRQLQIAAGQSIPGQPWTIVSKTTDGKYYMQIPVWGPSA
jgi:hypothetical protein